MNRLYSKENYQERFDSDWYHKSRFAKIEGSFQYRLQNIHKIFLSGEHRGVKCLDVGSGPCIYMALSASRIFPDIYLSDFSENNIQAVEKWRTRDPSAYDWTDAIAWVSKLEGISESKLEARTRNAIKAVLPCDLLADNILPPDYTQFDCITTAACIEAACPDMTSFKASVRKLAALLKPGGTIVWYIVLGLEWYGVGDDIFNGLPLTKANIMEALDEAKFEDVQFINDHKYTETEIVLTKDPFCATGSVYVTARLPNKVNKSEY